ncbi:aldolase [Halobacteriales archaeon QH_8_64_26]|nr:MAG: aldolase [Halobacteriales archaeon QH_8_64_26]
MSDRLRRRLAAREPLLGTWLSLSDPAVAEIGASLGYDFALIDTEHTPLSLETVTELVRAIEAADGETEAFVRVSWNDPVELKRVLDTGVGGVMVPMVNTAKQARQAVEATRYPPEGERGIAAGRAAEYGLDFENYVERANEEIATIVQIERERGVENAEAIAAVEEIDALLIGPADLSAALGAFGEPESDAFAEAIDQVLEAGEATDTPVGTLAIETEEVETRVEQGFDFLIAGLDAAHLIEGNRRAKRAYESALDGREDAADREE